MANYEATKYNFSGANLTDVEGVNTGIVIPWSDATPPSGFLECDGSAVSRTTYAALFAVVGTTYGSGDGSTTFNIPDLQDKLVRSRGPASVIATDAGSEAVECTGNIGGSLANTTISTPTLPSHSHPGGPGGGGGMAGIEQPSRSFTSGMGGTGSAGGGGAHNHSVTANFTGGNINPQQASLVLMYIIKT